MGVAATAATTIMSAGSSIMGGRARYSEGMTEAMIADNQAKDTDLQSLQLSERRREELRAGLAAYAASRAARGLDADSPSAIAIERELRRQSVRDEGAERYGLLARSSALRLQARARRKAAKFGLVQGYLNAGESIISGLGSISSQVASVAGGPMAGGAGSAASGLGGGAGGG